MTFQGLARRFLHVGLIYFVASLILSFTHPNAALDIQMHDNYLVLGVSHLLFVIAFLWLIDSCFYSYIVAHSMLSWEKTIGWITYGLLHIATVLIIWIPFTRESSNEIVRRYYRFDGLDMYQQDNWIPIGILLLCLSQVMMLMSFMASLVRVS